MNITEMISENMKELEKDPKNKLYKVEIKDDSGKEVPALLGYYSIKAKNEKEAEDKALTKFAHTKKVKKEELNGIVVEVEELV